LHTSNSTLRTATRIALFLLCAMFVLLTEPAVLAQDTNPVDRQVTNPMTDTPNVNPLNQDQPIRSKVRPRSPDALQPGDKLTVTSDKETSSGDKDNHIVVEEGNVDARIGTYRIQADKITIYEATNKVLAEGNVVFDQGDQQRITGSRAEWNYQTKTGFFINSTGFTNQTTDGTRLYFTADSVERVSLDTIVAINAEITACEDNVPKWSFKTKRAVIRTNDRARFQRPSFRVKGIPVIPLPYASISLQHEDRASGFLTPSFSGGGSKGFRLSNAYYQTLGRSADLTIRDDFYTGRGLGFGADLRTRANSRSYLYLGFYGVKDRIFGPKEDAQHPNQGGTEFFANGVHYFSNGFIAAVDVYLTSNLAFRQIFSDTIQQVISPEQLSQVFVNKNFGDYSLNFLARSQQVDLPNTSLRIRELPSVTLDKRPSPLHLFKKLETYFSFEGGAEGVSRKETTGDPTGFRSQFGYDPEVTPSVVQRLDFHPSFTIPLEFGGWSLTATGGARATYYSNTIDPATRMVLPQSLVRSYGELEIDFRPPSFFKNYHRADGSFFFRHVIEPYIIYRRIAGISDFDRTIRFDYVDAIADTNEIEYGLANRFFTRRSTENVAKGTPRANRKGPSLSRQPYEALSIVIRGKYFFDPYFGGALLPGTRNQFYPITTLSGFTFGGVPRRFSPVNLDARYRPSRVLFADVRMDFDLQNVGIRTYSTSFGLSLPLIQAFETFYYTRAISLVPTLAKFSDPAGKEPGTLKGSQLSPSVFLGNRDRGLFGGTSFFFDFQDRANKTSSLVTSTVTIGYSWNCCAVTVQNFTFNVGPRRENRIVFAFRLNGIGTFGTEQFGQRR